MPDAPKTDEQTQTPPWGDDFDAAKAWNLIQNLRAEKTALQTKVTDVTTERDTLKSERQARENEGKTAEQKAADDLTAAQSATAAARRELYIERALRKHAIPEDLVEFLSGDTEEDILAKAEKLAAVKPAEKTDEQQVTPPAPGMPTPALKPGHGGDAPVEFDPDAIADAARKSI
ncbi:hypothetical protein N1031_06905 [Herbiconiux moechotypicola]|uniref:Scaffolding protein n=1 Tax=Herbiconiux moechotypicola TaxID=637393 RepID=A0ABN3DG11_9MICO|nr:hypothetical protein [Herbiconiux moechotypicola]MCS5729485.1 hypothetical protein [Herbiconiux moechotypicola]